MLVSLAFFIIGFTMGGLNYVVTVLQARTRGMTMMRLPLTVWGIFMATILALLAFPALFVSAIMMLLDLMLGTSFFMPALVSKGQQLSYRGGNPLLFQHLFWFFGHPEVYIVALPAFGIVSDLISTHARKNIFGYRMMVWAILVIGGLSFIVWAHHMYVSGMNPYFGFFFATTTLIIAVPTAIKVYNWVLTLWRGNIHLTRSDAVRHRVHLHFRQWRSDRPVPRQRGGRPAAVGHDVRRRAFPHGDGDRAGPDRCSAPSTTGTRRSPGACWTTRLGKIHFWITFVGTYAIYYPMHYLGFMGVPRRYYAIGGTNFIPDSAHSLNAWITIAASWSARHRSCSSTTWSTSYFRGKPAGGNPWNATTLEWQTPHTPPKHGNFGKELPVVYRWAYDYGVPGVKNDFIPQNVAPARWLPAKPGPRPRRRRRVAA